MGMHSWVYFFLLTYQIILSCCLAQNCKPGDYDFTFTECESNGNRWKVAVPHPGKKCTTGLPMPVQGPKCGATCLSGEYLNIDSGKCAPCPPGTYSISNGRVFDYFDSIPPQLTIEAYPESRENPQNCSDSGSWIPYGTYLSSSGLNCASVMRFADSFVQDGFVAFDYQFTDTNRVAFVNVQNDKCQLDQDSSNIYLEISGLKEWRHKQIPLKKGRNIITWTTYMDNSENNDGEMLHSNLLIRSITINGLAYNRECTKCKAGSFSSKLGSTQCQECPKNTYSNIGSQACVNCNVNQYSYAGASKCIERKACQSYNKYQYSEACSVKDESRMIEAWTEPKVCRDDLKDSVHLIPVTSSKPESCLPCNKGETKLNATHCGVCPAITTNQPVDANCLRCPSNTQPIFGMEITRWSRWPSNMITSCTGPPIAGDEDCPSSNLWQLQRTHIAAGLGVRAGGYSILHLFLDKETNSSSSTEKENLQVSMNFSLTCVGNCSFIFMLDVGDAYLPLKIWRRSVQHEVYTHRFTQYTPSLVLWGFHKPEEMWTDTRYGDHVVIHSITVTGLLKGPVIGCKECPLGMKSTGCIPCPTGQYFSPKAKKCTTCPPGRVLNHDADPTSSPDKICIPCGENLIASKDHGCISSSILPSTLRDFMDSNNETLIEPFYRMDDVMKKEVTTTSASLFTSVGSKYYYVFNFTLANEDVTKYPHCTANYTSSKGKSSVRSLICRTTFIPSTKPGGAPVTAQVTSLGDELLAIKTTNSSEQFRKEINENLTQFGWNQDKSGYDIHYLYRSFGNTRACPQGRHTTVTLRCTSEEDAHLSPVEVSPRCPYGSCDGCHFHFLWRTVHACPVCLPRSYSQVEGECRLGRQTVHFIPPPHCYVGGRNPPEVSPRNQPCPLFTKTMMLFGAVTVMTGAILLLLLIYCHRRNKNLQYKYMKLVSAHPGGRDGMDDGAELPGVESCAVDEDEDFDQNFSSEIGGNKGAQWPLQPLHRDNNERATGVGFLPAGSQGGRIPEDDLSQSAVGGRKGGSANKLLGKLRNVVPISGDMRRGFDSLETVNLTESSDYGH